MRIKLPPRDSAGVVTAFYLTSKGNTHDEVDFELLGNRLGKPIAIQTNVFVPWFDPTTSFHTYGIIWNPYQLNCVSFFLFFLLPLSSYIYDLSSFLLLNLLDDFVNRFYVDKVPIRIFKNNRRSGVNYPSEPMQLVTSLWNGEDWATNGGKDKVNWAYAPFKAQFQGFAEHGCHVNGQSINAKVCGSTRYWWNTSWKYSRLSVNEQKALENVRAKYMDYDYCSDRPRYPVPPTECRWNK